MDKSRNKLGDGFLEGILIVHTSTEIPDMEKVLERHNKKILQKQEKQTNNDDEQISNEDDNDMDQQQINKAKNTLDSSINQLKRQGHVTIEMINYVIHMVRENNDRDSFGMLPAQSPREDTDKYYSNMDGDELDDELQFLYSVKGGTEALHWILIYYKSAKKIVYIFDTMCKIIYGRYNQDAIEYIHYSAEKRNTHWSGLFAMALRPNLFWRTHFKIANRKRINICWHCGIISEICLKPSRFFGFDGKTMTMDHMMT